MMGKGEFEIINHGNKKLYIITLLLGIFVFGFLQPAKAIEVVRATTVTKPEEKNAVPLPQNNQTTLNFSNTKENNIPLKEAPPMEIPNVFENLKKKKEAKISINETAPEKQAQEAELNSDEIEYFEDRNEIEARGKVVITTKPDGTKLSADKAVYNRDSGIIKLFGNVILEKNNSTMVGDFMAIDLNEENVLMNEPTGYFDKMVIHAQEGYAYANKIQAINGDIEMAKNIEMKLQSKGFGYYDDTLVEDELASFDLKKKRSEPLKIKTKEIIIQTQKEHDNIYFKNADVYYKKFKIASAGSIEVITDKSNSYIETSLPEFGSMKDFGTYIGWGFVKELPGGSTLKVMPALVMKSGVGLGVIGRFRSKRNWAEAGWATSSENLILRGHYKFNDNLKFEYSRHGYLDEWFLGGRRPGYAAQLVYHNIYNNNDLGLAYHQRFTGGYVTDYGVKESDSKYGSMRLRYQGQINKTLLQLGNREQDMYMKFIAYSQVAGTVYGTGDVTGLVRVGPAIYSRVKNWGSRISYALAGIHGRSPFKFDDYYYGKSSISIDENLRLGKYLALGYQGTFSVLKDNPDKDLLAENKFYAVLGPEDMKVAISYDTVRELARFDFLFLLGSQNTKIDFQKLTANDVQNVGKKEDLFENWKYYKVKVPQTL